jgi:hypothetical protein
MGIEMMVGLAISVASAAMQAKGQADAAQAQIDAAGRQAQLDADEQFRQAGIANKQAQADKSATVRAADASMASMIVGMGGAGGINTVRSAAEIGFTEGVDLARIEGNRQRQVGGNRARTQSAINRVTDANQAGAIQTQAGIAVGIGKVGTAFQSSGLSLSDFGGGSTNTIQHTSPRLTGPGGVQR